MPLLRKEFQHGSATPSVQKRQVVLGLLYSFIVTSLSPDGTKEHHFVVTRDRNKDFHLCKRTSRASDESSSSSSSLTCSRTDVLWDQMSSLETSRTSSSNFSYHLARGGVGVGAPPLKIASYNIWNVNKLRLKGETYKKRMERLGEVRKSLLKCSC